MPQRFWLREVFSQLRVQLFPHREKSDAKNHQFWSGIKVLNAEKSGKLSLSQD